MSEALQFLDDLFAKARKAGADAADGHHVISQSLSTSMRMGNREDLERSESLDMMLRVFIGQRQACVASSDTSSQAMDELVERAEKIGRAHV